MKGLISLLKSRKFILTLIPVITMVLNELGFADISNEMLVTLVTSIGVLVAAIAHEDANKIHIYQEDDK